MGKRTRKPAHEGSEDTEAEASVVSGGEQDADGGSVGRRSDHGSERRSAWEKAQAWMKTPNARLWGAGATILLVLLIAGMVR